MAAIIVVLGLWLGLSLVEWGLITVAIAFVFTGEMLNTVIEVMVDMVTPEYHPLAKRAKDVAAGAILLSAMAAVVNRLGHSGAPLVARVGWSLRTTRLAS